VDQIKKNPLNRALRIDKFTLASLECVLRMYFDEEAARQQIPTLRMLTVDPRIIEKRARRLIRRIKNKLLSCCEMKLQQTESRVGGGALPEEPLVSWSVVIKPYDISVNRMEENLRTAAVPVIGRIEEDCFLLDMRTVGDDEVASLASMLLHVFGVD
jgi:L-seryl-tRNA(Ser) seleniumtransferase